MKKRIYQAPVMVQVCVRVRESLLIVSGDVQESIDTSTVIDGDVNALVKGNYNVWNDDWSKD